MSSHYYIFDCISIRRVLQLRGCTHTRSICFDGFLKSPIAMVTDLNYHPVCMCACVCVMHFVWICLCCFLGTFAFCIWRWWCNCSVAADLWGWERSHTAVGGLLFSHTWLGDGQIVLSQVFFFVCLFVWCASHRLIRSARSIETFYNPKCLCLLQSPSPLPALLSSPPHIHHWTLCSNWRKAGNGLA